MDITTFIILKKLSLYVPFQFSSPGVLLSRGGRAAQLLEAGESDGNSLRVPAAVERKRILDVVETSSVMWAK
jgi:hypothetical protein